MGTKFKATSEQIVQMVTNAVNASRPMGFGVVHYENVTYTTTDIMRGWKSGNIAVDIDYFCGRMVKLSIKKVGEYRPDPEVNLVEPIYEFISEPREDYQSWVTKYPTNESLLESAGITPIKDNDDA